MFLVKLDVNNQTVLNPEVARLEPTLAKLSEDELRAIVLAFDYESIYKLLPESERMLRAHVDVFKSKRKNFWTEDKILAAVEVYKSCQYDERKESFQIYQAKIGANNLMIQESDSPASIKNYIAINGYLTDELARIEKELIMDHNRLEIRGREGLSFLENIMRNKEKYAEITRRRMTPKKDEVEEDA